MTITIGDSDRWPGGVDDSELAPRRRPESVDARTGEQLRAERETLRAVLSWAGTVLLFALLMLALSGCACSFDKERLRSDIRLGLEVEGALATIAADASASADARAVAQAVAAQVKTLREGDEARLAAQ